MRKSTKLAILVAALVALCSVTALAANTWKQEGDDWYCYDKDGNMIYGQQEKSGTKYYYLDDATGAMVKDYLYDDGANCYWYGADGARVANTWIAVPVENDDDGFEWMWFQSNGKAFRPDTAGTKLINGKKYAFDTTGYMLSGLLKEDFQAADNATDAAFYFQTKDNGAQFTGWYEEAEGIDGTDYEDEDVWFYFAPKKVVDGYKKVGGVKYNFDANGVMKDGWYGDFSATASYYVGGVQKTGWVYTDKWDPEDGNSYWYYVKNAEVKYANSVTKISKKFYLFNDEAQMVGGIVVGTNATPEDPTTFVYDEAATKAAKKTLDAYKDLELGANEVIMFFSADYENDGSMKTGAQTVTIDGDEATVYFDKHGVAKQGIDSKKIYNNGILQAAGDSRIAVKKNAATGAYYLVNGAGSILSNYKGVNADGVYYVASGAYDDAAYAVYSFDENKDYAANAATAVKNLEAGTNPEGKTFNVRVDGKTVTYTLYVKAVKDGYKILSWSK